MSVLRHCYFYTCNFFFQHVQCTRDASTIWRAKHSQIKADKVITNEHYTDMLSISIHQFWSVSLIRFPQCTYLAYIIHYNCEFRSFNWKYHIDQINQDYWRFLWIFISVLAGMTQTRTHSTWMTQNQKQRVYLFDHLVSWFTIFIGETIRLHSRRQGRSEVAPRLILILDLLKLLILISINNNIFKCYLIY